MESLKKLKIAVTVQKMLKTVDDLVEMEQKKLEKNVIMEEETDLMVNVQKIVK
jgi:hypothetical protein